jgi:transcriptional regulator with XRE-family HTH domain
MTKEKKLKIEIGQNIKAIREALELTQEAFSAKLDSSGRMIREYEKNNFPATSEIIGLMIQEYKVNPVFLFTGFGEMFLDAEAKESYLQELKNKYSYDNKDIDKIITELLNSPTLAADLLKLLEVKKKNVEVLKVIGNFLAD